MSGRQYLDFPQYPDFQSKTPLHAPKERGNPQKSNMTDMSERAKLLIAKSIAPIKAE